MLSLRLVSPSFGDKPSLLPIQVLRVEVCRVRSLPILDESGSCVQATQWPSQDLTLLEATRVISVLYFCYRKYSRMVEVRVDSHVKCELSKKPFTLTVKNCSADSAVTFKKVGNNDLTLLWPTARA